jgi:glutathione S-transferase
MRSGPDGSFTLFGRPGSGSAAVEAMLALTGAPHVLVDIDKSDAGAVTKLSALNPLGQVPTLVLPDGEVMTESAAMMIHLADRFPAFRLSPAPGDALRAGFLRMAVFLSANLYMSFLRQYYPDRYTVDSAGAQGVQRAAVARIDTEWAVFDGMLVRGGFALGGAMSAVDLYAAMLMDWTNDRDGLWTRHPRLAAISRAVAAHPGVRPIWKRHGISPPGA